MPAGPLTAPATRTVTNYSRSTGQAPRRTLRGMPAAMPAPPGMGPTGPPSARGGPVANPDPRATRTGPSYASTYYTPTPEGPHVREQYGYDRRGNESLISREINPGYDQYGISAAERWRSEQENRDRIAEIRATGEEGRLTAGQEQGWTTAERGRGRSWELEDDKRMFERIPGLWEMITGEGGQAPAAGGSAMPASMAALSGGPPTAGGPAGSGMELAGLPGGRVDPSKSGVVGPPTAGAPGTPSAGDMAFARAKSRAGQLAARRVKDARSATANMSAGVQGAAADAALGGAADTLSEVAVQQAIQEANRAAQVEDRDYAGALQRRGQNLGIAPSILALLRTQGRAY